MINVTPLIDVLLVLLILFMLVSPQKGVDVGLAEAAASPPVDIRPLVLMVEDGGRLLLDEQEVTSRDLGSKLKEALKARADGVLFIKASPKLKYRDVVSVIDLARASGVARIGILR